MLFRSCHVRMEGGRPGVPPLRKKPSQTHRRGRTLAGPPYPGTAGGASPSPTVLKKLFRDWVGEAKGPPAVDDSGQKVTLIRPLRGHLSISHLSLRDIIPTPFGPRPFPPDRGNRPLDKGSRPPWRGKARAADSRPYGEHRSRLPFRRGRSQTGPQLRTTYHLFGQTRRSRGTAPAAIFANPGPGGPAGIEASHSDFARRKFCAALQVRVLRNGVRGKRSYGPRRSEAEP